jgi:hypothetical protein
MRQRKKYWTTQLKKMVGGCNMGKLGQKRGHYKKKIVTMNEMQEARLRELEKQAPPKIVTPSTPANPAPPIVETTLQVQGRDVEIFAAPPSVQHSETAPTNPENVGPDAPDTSGEIFKITPEEMEETRLLLRDTMKGLVNPGGIPIFRQDMPPVEEALADRWSKYAARVLVRKIERPIGDNEALIATTAILVLPRIDYHGVVLFFKKKPTETIEQTPNA